jgi:hypothetical protein
MKNNQSWEITTKDFVIDPRTEGEAPFDCTITADKRPDHIRINSGGLTGITIAVSIEDLERAISEYKKSIKK